jgi:hypothetical protein
MFTEKRLFKGGVSPLFVCVYLNIFMREGGTGEGLQEQGTGEREGETGGTVSLRTPHPKTTEGEKNSKKLGTEGTKTPPPP